MLKNSYLIFSIIVSFIYINVGNASVQKNKAGHFLYSSRITTKNSNSKLAIIVAGSSHEKLATGISENAKRAYRTLIFQEYTDDTITFLCPTSFDGVDNTPSIEKIKQFINTAATDNTQALLIYFIGDGDNNAFMINQDEILYADELNNCLDAYQEKTSGAVVLIYDACQAKSFVDIMKPINDQENVQKRILIASTDNYAPSYFLENGDVSFSNFFWNQILKGSTTKDAFLSTSTAMKSLQNNQLPYIFFSADIDSVSHRIGFGNEFSSKAPILEQAHAFVKESSAIEINAEYLVENDGIEKVFAIITPPDNASYSECVNGIYCGATRQKSTIVKLYDNDQDNIFKNTYNDVLNCGIYHINIFAKNMEGILSQPESLSIINRQGADIYESDNSFDDASVIDIDNAVSQIHNFHKEDDEDFVTFYALKNQVYTIEVESFEPDENINIYIRLYIDKKYIKSFTTANYKKKYSFDWTCTIEGQCHLKLMHPETTSFKNNTGYTISIKSNNAAMPCFIQGVISNYYSEQIISGAFITTDRPNISAISKSDKKPNYLIVCSDAGSLTLFVNAEGYIQTTKAIQIEALEKKIINFQLTPIYTIRASTIGGGGSISPSGYQTIEHGSNITFKIIPQQCYTIQDVMIDGIWIGPQNLYTFSNVAADHKISARFAFTPTTFNSLEDAIIILKILADHNITEICLESKDIGLKDLLYTLHKITER